MLLGQKSPFTHPNFLAKKEILPLLRRNDFRERQLNLLKRTNSAVICILGHDIQYATQNIFYPFQQNNNLLYLCGASEERRCALVLEKDLNGCGDGLKSTLFLPERNSELEKWWGPSTGLRRGIDFFGVNKTFSSSELGAYLAGMATGQSSILYDVPPQCNLSKFSLPTNIKRSPELAVLLSMERLIKSPIEREMMRRSAMIASEAFNKTIPNNYNNEAFYAARMEFESKMLGASSLSYAPVVAGSPRSCYIHWIRSDHPLGGNELMLMDAGIRHPSGYCSDISRTWPLCGIFTEAQAALYKMVLRVQKICLNELKKSPSLNELHSLSIKEMAKGIVSLGFEANQIIDLYPHHIGHHLGLDVHDCIDAPLRDVVPLREGHSITIEPGIYIPNSDEYPPQFRGLGIRIEDDILIGSNGSYEIISSSVPKEIEEIESLLKEKNLFT